MVSMKAVCCFTFMSRRETFLDNVAFLRRKPAIASYGMERGEKERKGSGIIIIIKRMGRTLVLFVCEVAVPG